MGIVDNPTALQTGNATLAVRTLLKDKAIGCLFSNFVRSEMEAGLLIELPVSAGLPQIEVSMIASEHAHARRAAKSLLSIAERELNGGPPI